MCLEKFCGKMCGMHRNPINCLLHLIAAVVFIYALWMHNIKWVLIALLIAVIGHIIQAVSTKKPVRKERKKRR